MTWWTRGGFSVSWFFLCAIRKVRQNFVDCNMRFVRKTFIALFKIYVIFNIIKK
jgi:hypothetical protein